MKTSHLDRRPCLGRNFGWSRFQTSPPPSLGRRPRVVYRLFMRDNTGKSYMEERSFDLAVRRWTMARELRAARQQLRWSIAKVNQEHRMADALRNAGRGGDSMAAWLDAGMPGGRGEPW